MAKTLATCSTSTRSRWRARRRSTTRAARAQAGAPASAGVACDGSRRAGRPHARQVVRDVISAFPPRSPIRPTSGHLRTEADVADVPRLLRRGGARSDPVRRRLVRRAVRSATSATYSAVTIDPRHLDGVLDIDRASQTARIQAGGTAPCSRTSARGSRCVISPVAECSTLTAGSHPIRWSLRTLYTTSTTSWSRCVRRPVVEAAAGSGRGRPSLPRLQGILGVITEAWMRPGPPQFRAQPPGSRASSKGCRRHGRSPRALHPSNCQLLDATEAWSPAPTTARRICF
jgi:hypothetical protein